MFEVIVMVCVLYQDGERHCDVRSKAKMQFASAAECQQRADGGVISVSRSALKDQTVVAVIGTHAKCAPAQEGKTMVADVLDQVARSGASAVHTEY